jgi:hypothetical protein
VTSKAGAELAFRCAFFGPGRFFFFGVEDGGVEGEQGRFVGVAEFFEFEQFLDRE